MSEFFEHCRISSVDVFARQNPSSIVIVSLWQCEEPSGQLKHFSFSVSDRPREYVPSAHGSQCRIS